MKITDLRCAVIGKHPIVRIVTDEGLSGYGEVEAAKPYIDKSKEAAQKAYEDAVKATKELMDKSKSEPPKKN